MAKTTSAAAEHADYLKPDYFKPDFFKVPDFGQFQADFSRWVGDFSKSFANGKVWTGEQAASMKLIDNVGDFEAAVSDTAKSVGIKGEPTLVRPDKDRRTLADLLLGDISQYLPSREKVLEQQVGFYYLWK